MLGLRLCLDQSRTLFFSVVGFSMLGLRSAVFEISGNTIFEHGGFFLHAY